MPSTRLKTTAAVWGGVGLAAVTIRALKRWRNRKREAEEGRGAWRGRNRKRQAEEGCGA